MKPLELYIHIPFCVKKCKYCDFLSAPASAGERERYVESLCRQIRSCKELAEAYAAATVFVGGGTPSILEGGQVLELFRAVRESFSVLPEAEITIEANPGTVSREKLKAWKQAGINRLSIGLQSVRDEELRALGRIHTCGQFLDTYRMAREEGFSNLNVDLISAIPHQTPESWRRSLETVAELSPEHISAYSLMIEEGTPFYEKYGEGRNSHELPGEEEERQMYCDTRKILASYGYHRYEISNYAKPGYACRHNLGYWSRAEYLGVGSGAASLIGNRRWTEGGEPERLSIREQMAEYMFLGLRKTQGVSVKEFERLFGKSMGQAYGKILQDMGDKGLLEEADGYIRLTERGIDVSNYVMREFL